MRDRTFKLLVGFGVSAIISLGFFSMLRAFNHHPKEQWNVAAYPLLVSLILVVPAGPTFIVFALLLIAELARGTPRVPVRLP